MASITITFTHPQASFTRTINVADADLVRLVQAAKANFYRAPRPGPEGARVGDPGPLTNQQALERLVASMWGELRRMTKDYEENQAIIAARDSVTSIAET